MELPAYHIPGVKTVLLHVWERLKGYVKKAGTVIFLACAVMWFLSSFGVENGAFGLVESSSNSIMAFIGNLFAWLFIPLGFGSWQPVAASISGLVAKESVVSTIAILGNISSDVADAAAGDMDADALKQTANAIIPWFSGSIGALSFLVFNSLNSPCLAAIASMAKELNSKKWFWFAIAFQNINAYCISLMIYQLIGLAVGQVPFSVFTIVAALVLAMYLYLLFRPETSSKKVISPVKLAGA
jgi:ferrous iron transport protein B